MLGYFFFLKKKTQTELLSLCARSGIKKGVVVAGVTKIALNQGTLMMILLGQGGTRFILQSSRRSHRCTFTHELALFLGRVSSFQT